MSKKLLLSLGLTIGTFAATSLTSCLGSQEAPTDNTSSLHDMHRLAGQYGIRNVKLTANADSTVWNIGNAEDSAPVITIDFTEDAVEEARDKGKDVYQVVMMRAKYQSPQSAGRKAYDCRFGFFKNSYDIATVSDGGDLTIMLNGGPNDVQASSQKDLIKVDNKPAAVTVRLPVQTHSL